MNLNKVENFDDSHSFSNSSISFNSLKRSDKNITNSNEFLSDIENEEEEDCFMEKKLNLERLKKTEKNNLSIIFDNLDSILGYD